MGTYLIKDCRVDCPLRGIVDVDQCYLCPRFRSVAQARKGPSIRCTPPAGAPGIDRQVFMGGMVLRKWEQPSR